MFELQKEYDKIRKEYDGLRMQLNEIDKEMFGCQRELKLMQELMNPKKVKK